MFQTTLDICHRFETLYTKVSAFVNAVTELSNKLLQVKSVAGQQLPGTLQGVSAQKQECEIALVDETIKIANALYVMATDTNDTALLPKVTDVKYHLYRIHDQETLTIAKGIATEAANYAAVLADTYGVAVEERRKLNEGIVAYEKQLTLPCEMVVENKQITANIAVLIAEGDAILRNKMDKLMPLFKSSSPDFYAEYFNARNVINTAARKRVAEEGTAKE